MIFIGSDHRGFELKELLKQRLVDEGYKLTDLGNDHLDPQDDYVLFAEKVARAVVGESNPERAERVEGSSDKILNKQSFSASQVQNDNPNKGILLCGSGAGVDMVANKVQGIRSALVFDLPRAKQAREHEDANVIALPADTLDLDQAWDIIQTFLNTPFSGEVRHERRLEEMEKVESEN